MLDILASRIPNPLIVCRGELHIRSKNFVRMKTSDEYVHSFFDS